LIVTFTKYEKVEKTVDNDIELESIFDNTPSAMENSTSKEFVWMEPDPDTESPSDTETAQGSESTRATNRHYLVKFE